MKFFISKIFFQNRSPFDLLDIDLNENDIAVLTAANGRGKTTILSHIVDALHEIAKTAYHTEFEGIENKFYRISNSLDNLDENKPSIFYLRAKLNDEDIDFVNIRGEINEDDYNGIPIENKIDYKNLKPSMEAGNVTKHASIKGDKKKAQQIFDKNIATYFPAYRFEQPGYINSPYDIKLEFNKRSKFSGEMINPLEVVSGLTSFANWLMDIVLDMHYQEANVHHLKANLDQIITLILLGKYKKPLRFGIGPRGFGNTRIQILEIENQEMVYPTIFNLSSGEAAALCLFGELIRQADNIDNTTNISNATGVVLIDEIDKHLHIKLQKEVLPSLIKLFPNIQFIITSHSPFFSMGLAETEKARSKIIDLDNFGITKDPTTNELYTEVYNMITEENSRFRDIYRSLKEEIEKDKKPLIITEGKTDVQHLKTAQEKLGIELDVEYFSTPGDWGDSKLRTLIEQLSKIKQNRIVVGIFDRDVQSIVQAIENNGEQYKSYGNNVYGMCLPIPAGREQHLNISIEFFYTDAEITKENNGKRLHFDNEVGLIQPGNKQGRPKPVKLEAPDITQENTKKIFDTDIGDLVGAHSKSKFADLIETDAEFSKEFDFTKFTAIFGRLSKILEAANS